MKKIATFVIVTFFSATIVLGQSKQSGSSSWPHPIPARLKDGNNREVFVMTLGDVKTPLADGVFNPTRDQVTLKDGSTKQNYYKQAMGIKFFQPINKSRFPLPPSGWCSWYFYYQEINEDEVKRNAKWIAENLKDYGASVVQLDDGWQGIGRGLGENRDWTTIDKRFAGGMDKLAAYIKSFGLTPGIWLAPHGQSNESVVRNHAGVFMLKPDGTSASSTWEGTFLVDPSTAEGQEYLKQLFKTLASWGYDYFKIDGQPIVIREYRNKKASMKNPPEDSDQLYRKTLDSIREAIGPDRYLLGCWVVPLEGVGIMNGSRIGADILPNWDGFKFAMRATMEYYFLHNVAWYADPDVMVVRSPLPLEQARAWATLQGLTGQAVLTSDRLMDLSAERVELLRRVYPAVDIRPLDLFKSERNKRIWDLKINHLGRNYDVVGFFNYDEQRPTQMHVSWQDLGLPSTSAVHVFDFWNKEYLGALSAGISLELAPASSRTLTLLPATDDVQLISTSRHITQGWVDLIAQRYNRTTKTFTGRSRVVKNDPYSLRFVFLPGQNFAVKRAEVRTVSGVLPVKVTNHQGWAAIEAISPRTTEVSWEVSFEPAPIYRFPVREPQNLWAEPVGIDGANLRWHVPHQPTIGYQVTLNGNVIGVSPTQLFALRNLNPNEDCTVEVRTLWQDGKLSEKKAELKFTLSKLLPMSVPLSSLQPVRITPGWRQPEMNRNFNSGGLNIAGRHFETGIGMPTNSEIEFELNGAYQTFVSEVGINDENNNREAVVEFALLGDGKELWKSGPMKKADGAKSTKIGVSAVKRLTLKVSRVGEGGGRIHADWADAKLVKE